MTIVAVNKVVFGENILIDLSGDDITAEKLLSGATAHAADGSPITGSLPFTPSGNTRWYSNSESNPENVTATTVTRGGADYIRFKHKNTEDRTLMTGSFVALDMEVDNIGDATAEDVMVGKTFTSAAGIKVTGTHECSSSGGSSNNNCEAYHITSASDVISFKGTGTVHVYGFAYSKKSTYSITQYSFVGDGWYTGSYYGAPTKTSATFSINADGTLSGLPSSLTALELLVVIGV